MSIFHFFYNLYNWAYTSSTVTVIAAILSIIGILGFLTTIMFYVMNVINEDNIHAISFWILLLLPVFQFIALIGMIIYGSIAIIKQLRIMYRKKFIDREVLAQQKERELEKDYQDVVEMIYDK